MKCTYKHWTNSVQFNEDVLPSAHMLLTMLNAET